MLRKQLIGITLAAAAIATLALVWHYRIAFAPYVLALDDSAGRLAFALTWLLLPPRH
ncbi:MAG TPA: hypothetical protein VF472_19880 [Burkholderiaceae bacterium]